MMRLEHYIIQKDKLRSYLGGFLVGSLMTFVRHFLLNNFLNSMHRAEHKKLDKRFGWLTNNNEMISKIQYFWNCYDNNSFSISNEQSALFSRNKWFMNLSKITIPTEIQCLLQLGNNFSSFDLKKNCFELIKSIKNNVKSLSNTCVLDLSNLCYTENSLHEIS